jgi:serine/threonine-protein kinase
MIVVDEGRLLAKVRHRGVVTVFGAARAAGFAGLWMELIQGATFEEIIQQQGRFSAREAALFGAEVCEALAAVHSAGLLHRDVKAQNVMRDRSGRVVLMDFGTGRLREIPDEAAVADLAGTPLYMAPELFTGGAATQTDVQRRRPAVPPRHRQLPLPARSLAEYGWGTKRTAPSGCVTSAPISPRPTSASSSARCPATPPIATPAPASWSLRSPASSRPRRICPPDRRTDPAVTRRRPPAPRPRRRRRSRRDGPIACAARGRSRRCWPGAAAGVAGRGHGCRCDRPSRRPCILAMTPPGTEDFLSFSLAPDGSQVAFTAEGKLWTRPLGSVEARPVADSAGAHDPFWSYDSRSVAYFKQNALWVTGIGGGESRYLCPSWNAMGGSWGADGTILFAADFGRAIYRIPSAGGERVPIRLQGEHGTDLRWPSFVPGTTAFIYSSRRAPEQPRMIMLGRVDASGGDQVLIESDANAQVAADRLLFVRNGRLFAQPFDGRALRLTGTPRPVAAERIEPRQPRGLRQLPRQRHVLARIRRSARSTASWSTSTGGAGARRSSVRRVP